MKMRQLKNQKISIEATVGMSLRSNIPLSTIAMKKKRVTLSFQDPYITSINWLMFVWEKLSSTKSMNWRLEILCRRRLMLVWKI